MNVLIAKINWSCIPLIIILINGCMIQSNKNGTKENRTVFQDDENIKILYLSERDETIIHEAGTVRGGKLYKKDLSNGTEICISNANFDPGSYTWSPDGKQITFVLDIEDEEEKLCIINEDGSDFKELFSFGDRRVAVDEIAWGERGYIAVSFSAYTGHDDTGDLKREAGLMIFDLDGKVITQLNKEYCTNLRWIEDGKKIAFISYERDKDAEEGATDKIYGMIYNVEDKKEVILSKPSEFGELCIFDEKRIVFTPAGIGQNIKIMNVQTKEIRELMSTRQYPKSDFKWSPDSRKIAYISTNEIKSIIPVVPDKEIESIIPIAPDSFNIVFDDFKEVWVVDIGTDRAKKVFKGVIDQVSWLGNNRLIILNYPQERGCQIVSINIDTDTIVTKHLTNTGINWGSVIYTRQVR